MLRSADAETICLVTIIDRSIGIRNLLRGVNTVTLLLNHHHASISAGSLANAMDESTAKYTAVATPNALKTIPPFDRIFEPVNLRAEMYASSVMPTVPIVPRATRRSVSLLLFGEIAWAKNWVLNATDTAYPIALPIASFKNEEPPP